MTFDADFARGFVEDNARAIDSLPVEEILRSATLIDKARQQGNRVFVIGNGGSASTAAHMACDLMKGTSAHGRPPVRVQCLSDNVPAITAWANDEAFEVIFREQLRVHGQAGDILIAVSGSGRSPNILRALEYAREHRLVAIGLLGMGGGPARDLCDVAVTVDSDNYEVIENGHLVVGHLYAAYLREHGREHDRQHS